MQEKERGERSIASGRKSDGGRETRGSHREIASGKSERGNGRRYRKHRQKRKIRKGEEPSNAHGRKRVLRRQFGQKQRRHNISKKKRGSANRKERTCR
jgi:hypothetical protein